MKKTILTSLATMLFALGAFAQGGVILDNKSAARGITTGGNNFYDGSAGIEIWYLNGSSYNLSSINGQAANPSAAYSQLSSSGFTLATSFQNAQVALGGFGFGGLNIPGVTPAGSPITLAVVAFTGTGSSFSGAANGGVLAFYQPTVDYTASPPPLPSDLTAAFSGPGQPGGFNTTDLVLNPITAVPEPSSFALAGLGAAAMLIFRRRK
jgi:hypothetical protein